MPVPSEQPPLDAGDWFPWRVFVHAAGGACGGGSLLLALAGLLTAEGGAALIGWFAGESPGVSPLPHRVGVCGLAPTEIAAAGAAGLVDYASGLVQPIAAGLGWPTAVAGWRLLVWALFGAAVARLAALRLTHHEPPGPSTAFRRSATLWRGNLLGAGALALGAALLFGLAASLGWPGLAVVSWPISFLLTLLAVLLMVGLVFGWPLSVAASAVERPDAFDALSRGIAYTYQRPLRLVAYLLQAWIVGAAAGGCVHVVLRPALAMTHARHSVAAAEPSNPEAAITATTTGAADFWLELVARAPLVYQAAYFWFAATAVYLLLRRDIDEQQADEVFLDDAPTADQAPAE